MFTIAAIVVIAAVGLFIWLYERYKLESFIAKAIDGNSSNDSSYVTGECQSVLDQLKFPAKLKLIKYMNAIQLPDGQRVSYVTGSMEAFQRYSSLDFQPTAIEWKILLGIVKRLYPN